MSFLELRHIVIAKMLAEYNEAMAKAKRDHLAIWQYGDITEDDAKEFGAGRPAR